MASSILRRRRWIGRVVLVLAGLVIAVALGEIAVRALRVGAWEPPKILAADGKSIADLSEILRVFGEPKEGEPLALTKVKPGTLAYGWYDRPRWPYFDARGCVEYRFDSLGFRDHEFALAKKPGELRVLAIGDSFTFGAGVQLDDTWPQVVERALAKELERPVEVVNAGIGDGYKPDLYAEWLTACGLKLDPDLVIVGVCLNDVFLDLPLALVDPIDDPWLGGRSRLLVLAQRLLAHGRGLGDSPWELNVRRLVKHQHPDLVRCEEGLAAMQRTLAGRDVRMIVAIFPMLTRLQTRYPFRGVHEIVRDFCASKQIECVDLLERFLGKDERELWVHPTDQHPNDAGHRLIAEGILGWLADHPIAPPRAGDPPPR